MNVTHLSGRLTKDVEPKESGKMAQFTLAVQRPYPWNKDRDGNEITDFFLIKILGEKNVDRAVRLLHKGTKIVCTTVNCRDTWKSNDEWREMNYMIMDDWEFAESKSSSSGGGDSQPSGGSQNSKPKRSFMDVDDDSDDEGIPFQ